MVARIDAPDAASAKLSAAARAEKKRAKKERRAVERGLPRPKAHKTEPKPPKATALAAKLEPPPRKDVYVKGAMEWEKNAWKVWDKKKVQEAQRRDKYSTALTSYLGGNKLVHRFEPPAITQCAHCDLGGGLHPLRRCMGCMAVAACCRMHQSQHWQWHQHKHWQSAPW